jgi:hypothetical protein
MKALGLPISFKAFVLSVLGAVVVAVGAYAIANSLTPVYQSSSTVRVVAPTQGAIGDPNVTAVNDLASQYAQLVGSDAVRQRTAKILAVDPSTLDGKLSGSTLAAQNLVEVTASAGSPQLAENRSAAATHAIVTYITQLNRQLNAQYLAAVAHGVVSSLQPQRLGHYGAVSGALGGELTNVRAQVVAQAVRDAAAGLPTLQAVDLGPSAGQTAPKPKLYALAALVVVLLLALRVSFVVARNSTE